MNTIFLSALSRNWKLLFFRGLFAVLFGVTALFFPGVTLLVLVILWGSYALVDGVLALMAAWKGGGPLPRWWLVLSGIAGVGAAAACCFYPGMTALVLLMIIGWWSVLCGILQIIGAISMRKEIDNEWWLILSGVLCSAFGGWVLVRPGEGALAIVWMIATFALAFGTLLMMFSFRLRKCHNHRLKHATA